MTRVSKARRDGRPALRVALLVILLTTTVLSGVFATGAVAATAAGTASTTVPSAPTTNGGLVYASTNAPAANNSSTGSGSVPLAEQTRISPVKFDRSYIRVQPGDKDGSYLVTGPYAVFASSKNVVAAQVAQPKASAKVLDGSRTVRVEFEPDASASDSTSLYTLKLFYADDSVRTIQLYVKKTDQFVAPARLQKADDLLDELCQDAKAHGYGCSISEIKAYHEWEQKQADIFSNWLGPDLQRAFVGLMMFFRSGILVGIAAIVIILAGLYLYRVHGHKIRRKVNSVNDWAQKRADYIRTWEQDRQTAAEEPLSRLDVIGPKDTVWKDGLNAMTVKQLADRFAYGEFARTEDNRFVYDENEEPEMVHDGIDDLLEADSLQDTWLEPVLRHNRLSPQEAIAHGKAAVSRMSNHYGQGDYADAYSKSEQLLSRLSSEERNPLGRSRSKTGKRRPRGTSAGGDD